LTSTQNPSEHLPNFGGNDKVGVALALRASHIMRRSNFAITAILAMVTLFCLQVDGLAKPVHRGNRRVASSVARRRAGMKATHVVRHRSGARDMRPRRAELVSRRSRRHELKARSIHFQQAKVAKTGLPFTKATSDDFLRAAAEADDHASSARLDAADQDKPNDEPSAANKPASVAKPVPAVNLVRRATRRPHLPSIEEAVAAPVILPALYNRRGRLIVPPPLRGSHEILVHQNEVADRDGLDRIQNDDDLLEMRTDRRLVALPANGMLQVDERLPLNRRYCRPWTAQFLTALSRAHYAHFHTALQVNSAVRTVEFQQHLMHINGNAAPAEGSTASPHLTGQAVDIAKHGLSLTEIAWLRGYLLPLVQEGKVDVEEEFQQSCFHISVYKRYLPQRTAPNRSPGGARHSGTTTLATAIRSIQ
jgi:hypothetical protein